MLTVAPGVTTHYPWTVVAAAATCALAPAYTLRWRVGFYPSTLLEVAIGLTVLVFLAEMRRQRGRVELRTPLTIPAVLLLGAGAISVLVAPDHRAALGLYRAYFIEPVAFFFVLGEVVRDTRQALWIIGGLALAVILLGIPNVAVTLNAIRSHTLNVGGVPPVAIYQAANSVAMFDVPVIALVASLLAYGAGPTVRVASALFLLFSVPALLLTLSRGGYLALFAVALGLALVHRRRLWFLVILAVAVIAVTRIGPIGQRLAHELSFSDPSNSLTPRLQLWRVTLHALEAQPILGGGIAGFSHAIAPYRGSYAEQVIYAHNIFLDFWIETGILGLIAFGWILIRAGRSSWQGWRRGPPAWRPLQLGVGLALVAIIVHGQVDSPYWKNDLSLLFWVLLALTWAGTRWGQPAAALAEPGLTRPGPPAARAG